MITSSRTFPEPVMSRFKLFNKFNYYLPKMGSLLKNFLKKCNSVLRQSELKGNPSVSKYKCLTTIQASLWPFISVVGSPTCNLAKLLSKEFENLPNEQNGLFNEKFAWVHWKFEKWFLTRWGSCGLFWYLFCIP